LDAFALVANSFFARNFCHRFFWAAAIRRRAAALMVRFRPGAAAAGAAGADLPLEPSIRLTSAIWLSIRSRCASEPSRAAVRTF
jgi:hypothetical protein